MAELNNSRSYINNFSDSIVIRSTSDVELILKSQHIIDNAYWIINCDPINHDELNLGLDTMKKSKYSTFRDKLIIKQNYTNSIHIKIKKKKCCQYILYFRLSIDQKDILHNYCYFEIISQYICNKYFFGKI